MSTFPTTTTSYSPEDLSAGERALFMLELGAAPQDDLAEVENNLLSLSGVVSSHTTEIGTAQTTADVAQTTADAAQTTADVAQTTTDEAVKLTGAQSVAGTKTFSSFPALTAPASPSGNQAARASDVLTGDNSIKSTTLGGVKMKILTFTGWDMQATDSIDIPHGITDYTKIIGITTSLHPVSGVTFRRGISHMESTDTKAGGSWQYGATNVTLDRIAGQHWDNALYANVTVTVIVFYTD